MPDPQDDPWLTIPGPPPATDGSAPLTEIPSTKPQRLDRSAEPLAALPVPLAPPGFEILGELGRGGMGVVYHARQTRLNREVALKMILAGGHSSAEDRSRFLAEAEAIAALNHPGIVQVYEFGTHAGQPFFALEYCSGGSLAKRLNGTPWPSREAAALVQKLAYAVHAAHEKGIVHRDLKPGNILMTKTLTAEDAEAAEKTAEAGLSSAYSAISAVKVTDFGLAKRVESGHPLTRTGAVMGTPSYMAPEQALGDGKRIGPATDVYALGAILYELFTGRPPFKSDNPFDTMLQVVNEDPVSVRQLQKKVPTDLETICHKALHKDPGRRYVSAKDLARDLGRWLSGEAIQARPVGQVEKVVKWAKRRPALASLIAVTTVAVLALVGGGLVFNAKLLAKQQELALKDKDIDDIKGNLGAQKQMSRQINNDLYSEREKTRYNLARSNLILADGEWKNGNALGTLKTLATVPTDLRHWEWSYQQRRAFGSYMTLLGHAGSVTSVAFSPDGTRLASGGMDGTVMVWDAKTGAAVQTLAGHTGRVTSVAFSSDGMRLASGGWDNTVRVWDAKTGAWLQALTGHTLAVQSVAFSHDGTRLASGSDDKTVRVWDPQVGAAVQTLTAHTNAVTSLAYSPDGTRLASGSADDFARVWDPKTGALIHTLSGGVGSVTGLGCASVAFSPDGRRLAAATGLMSVRVWDAQSGTPTLTITGQASPVRSVAFSPDCAHLAAASDDGTVRVWDAKSGNSTLTLTGHTSWVTSVAFSPDGTRLASGGGDKTVRVWDARTGLAAHTLEGKSAVESITFSPDGTRLASGGGDKTVQVWDVRTGAVLQRLAGHKAVIASVAFGPDGTRLASGGDDNTVRVWDAVSGAALATLTGHTGSVASVAFSPDGTHLASGSNDKTVRLWDAERGTSVKTLTGHTGAVRSVAFSPDGNRLASGGFDGTLRVWDRRTGAAVKTFGLANVVWSIAFSPDGTRLASVGGDKTVRIWDARTGDAMQTLTGHVKAALSVAFSPDGSRLASGSADGTVRVWDAEKGTAVQTLAGHNAFVTSVAFSPDGTRLASGSHDKTVRLWEGRAEAQVKGLAGNGSPVAAVAFSPDGGRLVGRDIYRKVTVWDVQTKKGIPNVPAPDWPKDDVSKSRSPDGQWFAIPHDDGTILLVHPLPPDEYELGYRAWFARPDPDWHWQQAQKFEKDQSWFAAAFHCEQVLKSRPDDVAAKTLLATAREHLKKP